MAALVEMVATRRSKKVVCSLLQSHDASIRSLEAWADSVFKLPPDTELARALMEADAAWKAHRPARVADGPTPPHPLGAPRCALFFGLLTGLAKEFAALKDEGKEEWETRTHEDATLQTFYENVEGATEWSAENQPPFNDANAVVAYMTVKKVGHNKEDGEKDVLLKIRAHTRSGPVRLVGELWDRVGLSSATPSDVMDVLMNYLYWRGWHTDGHAPRGPLVRRLEQLSKQL